MKDKRILELGCGPGFGLKVMQDLGAKVAGVELRRDYMGRVPVDIRYGDAEYIFEVAPEKFDIVYSRDLFCKAVLDYAKSGRIIEGVLPKSPLHIHINKYAKIPLPIMALQAWYLAKITDWDHMKDFERMTPEERADRQWTNEITLDPQHIIRAGYRLDKYKHENHELIIIASNGNLEPADTCDQHLENPPTLKKE